MAPTTQSRPSSVRRQPQPRRGRRRVLAVLASIVVALAAALCITYATLPGVGDAERRVAKILQDSRGVDTHVLPLRVGEAVVAVEDQRFYHHGALDFEAVARALVSSVRRQGVDPGGSTLSQQLAKVLYARAGGGSPGKLQALGLAYKLEQRYSKQRILEMYVNSVYYGDGYYGVEQAARGYFGTRADRLDWSQASLLAGLPQAPSLYDPRHDFTAARRRQRHVLARLVATRQITASQGRHIYDRAPVLRARSD